MAVDDSYRDYVVDILAQSGLAVSARTMFGGAGLYHQGRIIGVIVNNELYLKLKNPPASQKELKRFGRQYIQVPIDVLEDVDSLRNWTRDFARHGPERTDYEPRESE